VRRRCVVDDVRMSRRQREQWIAGQLRAERVDTVVCVAGCLLALSSVFWVPWLLWLVVR
jgi:folate-dependent phosphoribosylglycinamide formyltransferase PurN